MSKKFDFRRQLKDKSIEDLKRLWGYHDQMVWNFLSINHMEYEKHSRYRGYIKAEVEKREKAMAQKELKLAISADPYLKASNCTDLTDLEYALKRIGEIGDIYGHDQPQVVKIREKLLAKRALKEAQFKRDSNLVKDLYESADRKINIAKYGDTGNECVCCGRPVKINADTLWVHMNTCWLAVNPEHVTQETCAEITGYDSQGAFPIGPDCAEKMKGFTFKMPHQTK